MSDYPSSKFERGSSIAKTGLKMGTNYARHHLKSVIQGKEKSSIRDVHRKNANLMFNELSKLRGTALKMAQAMSLDTAMLPGEFAEVMTQAQYSVPPINRSLVRTLIKNELGDYPEKIFAKFEPDAFAAASLGQVHRAELHDGTRVAVKVQYPNVRNTIDSDLAMVKVIYKRLVKGRRADEYFIEVREKLMEETDYLNEGDQISFFHENYSSGDFVTPRWIPELSTGKVLTMTFIDGMHMTEFMRRHDDQEMRNRYGQLIWDFFHAQINDKYTVHADAHPGNFLYTTDGKLGVLDFGCVKVCPPGFFRNYMSLFVAHFNQHEDRMLRLYKDLEIIESVTDLSGTEYEFVNFTRRLGRLFVSPYRDDYFDFGDEEFKTGFNGYAMEAAGHKEPRGSKHFIFMSRAHLGMYQMLMKLDAVIDVRPGRKRLYDFLQQHELAEPAELT
jgi:predicted unusual protein kinase regulating ubiquinone biosynthesis (AarF/ABC1/UbiB family)